MSYGTSVPVLNNQMLICKTTTTLSFFLRKRLVVLEAGDHFCLLFRVASLKRGSSVEVIQTFHGTVTAHDGCFKVKCCDQRHLDLKQMTLWLETGPKREPESSNGAGGRAGREGGVGRREEGGWWWSVPRDTPLLRSMHVRQC